MSNEVKQWDYRYQERKEEAPKERHICGEPQCWEQTSLSQWYDFFHHHPHYLKDDALHSQLSAKRITRKRRYWSSNVSGIWVGVHCRLPTSEWENIHNYSLYNILQVNILVMDTDGNSTTPPTISKNDVFTKRTSEGGSVSSRQTVAAECRQEHGHRINWGSTE